MILDAGGGSQRAMQETSSVTRIQSPARGVRGRSAPTGRLALLLFDHHTPRQRCSHSTPILVYINTGTIALCCASASSHHGRVWRGRNRECALHWQGGLRCARPYSHTTNQHTNSYDLVFKIPPLKKNEGHRAAEWGDLGQPLWKGRLRIIERSAGVSIQFEDSTTGACKDSTTARIVNSCVDTHAGECTIPFHPISIMAESA